MNEAIGLVLVLVRECEDLAASGRGDRCEEGKVDVGAAWLRRLSLLECLNSEGAGRWWARRWGMGEEAQWLCARAAK